MRKSLLLPISAAVLLAGCTPRIPTGPSVMVLPGTGKDFEQFQYDDSICRDWALRQVGANSAQASADAAVGSAAVGTLVGAAAGAAIGAASGHPGEGAAVGSGIGLLGGSAVGADRAERTQYGLQRRYDVAYMQCMYAKGNQVPMRGSQMPRRGPAPLGPPGPSVPPPPVGSPPPPPPGTW